MPKPVLKRGIIHLAVIAVAVSGVLLAGTIAASATTNRPLRPISDAVKKWCLKNPKTVYRVCKQLRESGDTASGSSSSSTSRKPILESSTDDYVDYDLWATKVSTKFIEFAWQGPQVPRGAGYLIHIWEGRDCGVQPVDSADWGRQLRNYGNVISIWNKERVTNIEMKPDTDYCASMWTRATSFTLPAQRISRQDVHVHTPTSGVTILSTRRGYYDAPEPGPTWTSPYAEENEWGDANTKYQLSLRRATNTYIEINVSPPTGGTVYELWMFALNTIGNKNDPLYTSDCKDINARVGNTSTHNTAYGTYHMLNQGTSWVRFPVGVNAGTRYCFQLWTYKRFDSRQGNFAHDPQLVASDKFYVVTPGPSSSSPAGSSSTPKPTPSPKPPSSPKPITTPSPRPTPTPLTSTSTSKKSPCGYFGDSNRDTNITQADVTAILSYVAGTTTAIPGNGLAWSDVDKDGKITSSDALIVKQYVAGSITTFRACSP